MHRDSLGSLQKIVPGDVNWMTAGHRHRPFGAHARRRARERLDRARHSDMVALPLDAEDTEPSFEHHAAQTLPQFERNGVTLRVIAGTAFGHTSPARTFSRTLYVAAHFAPGSAIALEPEHDERGIYLVEGDLSIDGTPLEAAQMAVLTPGETVDAREPRRRDGNAARRRKARWRALIEWNFVASSREKIERAKTAWMNQQMGKVPGETEWIPLPERKPG